MRIMRLAIFLLAIASLVQGEGLAGDVLAGDVLVNGFLRGNAPFSHLDRHSRPEGQDALLFRLLAEDLGLRPEFRPVDWIGWREVLDSGQVDVMLSGLIATGPLRKEMSFSRPYREIRYLIVASSSLDDGGRDFFEGHNRLGVVEDSWYADFLRDRQRQEPNRFTIKYYRSLKEAQEALVAAEVDAVAARSDEIAVFPANSAYLVDQFADPDFFGVGVRKEDRLLLAGIDDFIAGLRGREDWPDLQARCWLKDDDEIVFGRTYLIHMNNTLAYDVFGPGWHLPSDQGISPHGDPAGIRLRLAEPPGSDFVRLVLALAGPVAEGTRLSFFHGGKEIASYAAPQLRQYSDTINISFVLPLPESSASDMVNLWMSVYPYSETDHIFIKSFSVFDE